MTLSAGKRAFFAKWFIFSIAVVFGALVAKIVMIVFAVILNIPVVSDLPETVNAAMFVVGLILAILLGVLCFKKALNYLKQEIMKSLGNG